MKDYITYTILYVKGIVWKILYDIMRIITIR